MSEKLCRLVEMKKTGGRKKLPLFLMLFSSFYFSSFLANAESGLPSPVVQQQAGHEVTGTVADSNGEPIIGASVRVAGSKQGTITDFNGNFKIKVPSGAKLVVSFVGYDAQTIIPPKSGKVNIVLAENSTMLGDVQVVAYGVQKKVSVTGAISGAKGDELVKTPVASVTNVLAGQISGISSIQYSGEPGADNATLYVRGRGSFNDSNPLIQVDGVTVDQSYLNSIDPNEIESLSVLKDASATAVFGIQGANGVILVTTKRGKEGKPKITFSSTESVAMPTKTVELANSWEYATFYNMMNRNDGLEASFSDEVVQKFKDHSDPIRFPDVDWVDYSMKKATFQSQNNVTVSGGTKTVRYFISAGMMTQGGMFKSFGADYDMSFQYKRFNYRANLDIDLTKSTTLTFNVAGRTDNNSKPKTGQGTNGIFKQFYYSTPFSSPGFVDGKLILTSTDYSDLKLPFTGSNGIQAYWGNGFYSTNNNTLLADLALKQKLDFITKGLSFHIKGSYNSSYYETKEGTQGYATYVPVIQSDGSLLYKKSGQASDMTYGTTGTGYGRNWYMEAGFDWQRDFGLHHLSGLLLYNQRKEYYPRAYSSIPHGLVGLVGRVTYDWNTRYMVEFNIGYNGSENFPKDKRFGVFPAGSVGWVVSEEKFWKPLKNVVSYLKFRASVGLVGNDYIGDDRFMYTPDPYNINIGNLAGRTDGSGAGYWWGINGSGGYTGKGAWEGSKHNADIGWEKALKRNYGVDINFLGDRLSTTFDYYKEHRTNIMLRDASAPLFIGFSVPYANLGVMDNWGWELSAKWQDKIGQNFRYWFGVNLSYNQNKIVDMKEAPMDYDYMYAKGHRLGSRAMYKFYGWYHEGIEQEYEKEFGKPFPQQLISNTQDPNNEKAPYLKPGDAVYVDLNGDGKIDGLDASRELGTYTDDPEYTVGVNMGFNWKNWDLTMQWTGAWNVSRVLSGAFIKPFTDNKNTNQGGLIKYLYEKSWEEGKSLSDVEFPRPSIANASQNYANSTLYERNSSYLRLKSFNLAYNFHLPFMQKLKINQFQLGISAYNLFTITSYYYGDPEGRPQGDAPNYPLQRTFAVNLKLGF